VVNQGGSTVLQTTNTCYNGAASPCTSTAITTPISQRSVSTQLGGTLNLIDLHTQSFDSYGNVTEQDDYDYDASPHGGLLSKTLYTYYSSGNVHGLPATVTICSPSGSSSSCNGSGTPVSQTVNGYDETAVATTSGTPQHNSVTGARGNLTSVKYFTQGSTYLSKTFNYFDTGNIQTATDVNLAQLTYTYGACGNSFPTAVAEPLSMSQNYAWDTNCVGGVMTSIQDENGNTTTATYNDPYFWRPASISYPDGGLVSWTYNSPTSTATTVKLNSSQNAISTALLDGLGRIRQTQLNSDPQGVDYVDTTYDQLGRVYTVSNPYRTTSDPTYGLTTYKYDALSRPTVVIPPDGSQSTNNVSASYSDNCVTAADQAGKKRKRCANSMGYLTQVFEDPLGANYETDYNVDPLGNPLSVTQKGGSTNSSNWRTRTYGYDLLSRLVSAIEPESGAVSYSYDTNGNLSSKTSPAPNQTGSQTVNISYCYDLLHRITAKVYTWSPNTPPVCSGTPPSFPSPAAAYTYDISAIDYWSFVNPKAHLVRAATFGPNSTASYYDYDSVGRLLHQGQCAINCYGSGQGPWTTLYTYDLAGNSTSYSDAAGDVFTYTIDTAGRPTKLTSNWIDANHPNVPVVSVDLTNGFVPNGGLRKLTLGNGVTETAAYNNRLQPCRMNENTSGGYYHTCGDSTPTSSLLDLTYGYNAGTSNNGDVTSWSATGNLPFNRSYTYDNLNRLSTMTETASSQTCKNLSQSYDAWGNRVGQTTTSNCYQLQTNGADANNRLIGPPYAYDAAGNMTNDGTHSYTYDPENRVLQIDNGSTAEYLYDANGHRVTSYIGGNYTYFIYGADDNVVSERANNNVWAQTYIRFGGTLKAFYRGVGTLYLHKDHLGSTRLYSDINGAPYGTALDYDPFGHVIAGSSTIDTFQFTDKELDPESGLNHFQFRKYSSALGRWMSPDPGGLAVVNPQNPQSWNRYSYVLNNPLEYIDLSGLNCMTLMWVPDDSTPEGGSNQWVPAPGLNQADCQNLGPNGLWFGEKIFVFVSSGDLGDFGGLLSTLSVQTNGHLTNTTADKISWGCVTPTPFQSAGIRAQGWLAKLWKKTIGLGAGLSAGASPGMGIGMNFSASRQLVVSPDGQAAYVNTFNNMWQLPFNAIATKGAGGYGGIVGSVSSAQTPQDLSGLGLDFGAGGGRGWGVGLDGSLGQGTQGQLVWSVTGTGGLGLGGYGHGFTTTISYVNPICGQ
jgi:RHS repeat-associated protein